MIIVDYSIKKAHPLIKFNLLSFFIQVSVPIVSNEKCQSMFLRAGRHEVIPDIFMCAGYENGGRDSCQVRFASNIESDINLI